MKVLRGGPGELPSELVCVVLVRVVVLGHHHSVGKLAAGERLHGLLAVAGGHVLHENLQGHKEDGSQSEPSTSTRPGLKPER